MISNDTFSFCRLKCWTVICDVDEGGRVWWSDVQKGCTPEAPILTSVAFFSASSSFSWASLRASENLSNSSSVPFSFFCRATKSSSSWGAFQCAGSFRGGQRDRAQAHRSDRERRRGRERKRGRESGESGEHKEEGKREQKKLGEPLRVFLRYLGGDLLGGQQLFLSGLELLNHSISFVFSDT